jgi:hypothetical protein
MELICRCSEDGFRFDGWIWAVDPSRVPTDRTDGDGAFMK